MKSLNAIMKRLDSLTSFVSSFLSNKINERNRYFVLGGILIAILLVDFLGPMMGQVRNLAALTPKISTLSKDLKQSKDDIKNISQYQAEVLRLHDKMEKIGTTILSKEEISMILENISRIAYEANVKITQIMPHRDLQELALTNNEMKYFSLPIIVNAQGGYHHIGRFFNRIENDKIFMHIKEFSLTATDDPMRHSLAMTIETFVREKADSAEGQ